MLLVDQLSHMAAHHPDEIAYVDLVGSDDLTFQQWESGANRLARELVARGVRPGDRVALYLESSHVLRWIQSYAAIHRCGAVAVPINTRLTAPELSSILAHAAPVAAITSATLVPILDAARPASVRIRFLADSEWESIATLDDSSIQPPITDDDLADIMYTSGTTGLPKGIAVRHRQTHIIPAGAPAWTGDAWLVGSPLFTFAGLSFVYNPMKMGMRCLYQSRFDASAWIQTVETERPVCAFVVPSMAQLITLEERFDSADLSSISMLSIGSAPLPPSLHARLAARLTNATVSNSYSMTEAGTAFTYMPPGELERHPGSVGIPMGTEIRIAGDDGEPLPPGEIGEILIGVGEDHREYYNDPDATAATWSGPWLRSGDLGTLDAEGYLSIVGRKKDVIIRGGNNVHAADVESVLYTHPAILEAAVVGVPHDILGEDIGAAIVVRPHMTLTAAEVVAFCRERLADYRSPRRIWFIDELPRNPTGKVVKRDLVPPEQRGPT